MIGGGGGGGGSGDRALSTSQKKPLAVIFTMESKQLDTLKHDFDKNCYH